jgi:hypothetical protein
MAAAQSGDIFSMLRISGVGCERHKAEAGEHDSSGMKCGRQSCAHRKG